MKQRRVDILRLTSTLTHYVYSLQLRFKVEELADFNYYINYYCISMLITLIHSLIHASPSAHITLVPMLPLFLYYPLPA